MPYTTMYIDINHIGKNYPNVISQLSMPRKRLLLAYKKAMQSIKLFTTTQDK